MQISSAATTTQDVLLVEHGAATRAVPLTRPVTHLGRGLAADVRLDEHTVSRRHATILLADGRARIVDDRSTNGTWVNGERVVDAALADGDVIALGAVRLTFCAGSTAG